MAGQVLGGAWDAGLYDARHAFVWKSAGAIVEWLAPQSGEFILDVGCGTGHVTAEIARAGAQVTGLDASDAMLETARSEHAAHDSIRWLLGDARAFSLESLGLSAPLDAIFSNATLHWVRPPESFLKSAVQVLAPGGRLVAEFGGRDNVENVLASIEAGLHAVGAEADVRQNYFPSLAEYSSLCEDAGLAVLRAELIDRPTPLQGDDGLREWARMFRPQAIASVEEPRREAFFEAMEAHARPQLRNDDGWFADYKRLRILAVKQEA